MPLTKLTFKRLFVIKIHTHTHKTCRTCFLLQVNQTFAHSDFFLVTHFGHQHLNFLLESGSKTLWLTRTLHHPVLSETSVSALMGWPNATPESCKKTKPSFTMGLWHLIFPGPEQPPGQISRLLFIQKCFIWAAHINTKAFKRFPEPCCQSTQRQRPN